MVVSVGASLLLYALGDGREVRADAGPDNRPFPEDPTRDAVLTWCAGLRASRPPKEREASVEVRPSTRRAETRTEAEHPGVSEARAVVLVSCQEFGGPGPWMSPAEEQRFMQDVEAGGRRVARLGPEVAEPWSI